MAPSIENVDLGTGTAGASTIELQLKLLRAVEILDAIVASDIEDADDRKPNQEHHLQVARLCQEYPCLVSHKIRNGLAIWRYRHEYWYRKGFDTITPLGYLIMCGASLSIIQSFIESTNSSMIPKEDNIRKNGVVQLACAHSEHVSPGVIAFLVKLFPEQAKRAIQYQNYSDFTPYPFFHVMGKEPRGVNNLSDEDMKALGDATFPLLTKYGHDEEMELVSLLFRATHPRAIQCVASQICNATNLDSFKLIRCWENTAWRQKFTLDHAKALATTVLPSKSVDVVEVQLGEEHLREPFLTLLGGLKACSAIKCLDLAIFWEISMREEEILADTLVSLSASLEKFKLDCYGRNSTAVLPQAIVNLIEANSIQCISLYMRQLYMSPQAMGEAIKCNTSLQELPCIFFSVDEGSYDHMQTFVSSLLHYNFTLQEVGLRYLQNGHDPMCYKELIGAIALLNGKGRYKLKDPNIKLSTILNLLSDCATVLKTKYSRLSSSKHDIMAVNLVYSILHVCPSKWSSSSLESRASVTKSGKKRSHDMVA